MGLLLKPGRPSQDHGRQYQHQPRSGFSHGSPGWSHELRVFPVPVPDSASAEAATSVNEGVRVHLRRFLRCFCPKVDVFWLWHVHLPSSSRFGPPVGIGRARCSGHHYRSVRRGGDGGFQAVIGRLRAAAASVPGCRQWKCGFIRSRSKAGAESEDQTTLWGPRRLSRMKSRNRGIISSGVGWPRSMLV